LRGAVLARFGCDLRGEQDDGDVQPIAQRRRELREIAPAGGDAGA
jgi:hypothetical protein